MQGAQWEQGAEPPLPGAPPHFNHWLYAASLYGSGQFAVEPASLTLTAGVRAASFHVHVCVVCRLSVHDPQTHSDRLQTAASENKQQARV